MLELLASDYRSLVQDVLSVSLIMLAFIWGSGPERAVAATWLIAFEILGLIVFCYGLMVVIQRESRGLSLEIPRD